MNQSPLIWKAKRCVKEQQKGKIVFSSYMQRQPNQWSTTDKVKLILSLLQGQVIPPVYAYMEGEIYSVIDGLQRLTTIRGYFEGEYPLEKDIEPIKIDGIEYNVSNKYFNDLEEDVVEFLEDAEIGMIKLENYTTEQLKVAFMNLNRSCPLSKDQMMRPELGEYVVNEIDLILKGNFIQNKTNFSNTQLHRQENQTAILICLMLVNEYPYRSFLNEHILEFAKFYGENYSTEEINKCKEILNKLDLIFESKVNVLGKLNLVSFFYIIKISEELEVEFDEVKAFLNDFVDNYESKKEYIELCSSGTASKKKVNQRFENVTNEFLNYIDKNKKGEKRVVNE